jgi:glycerol-3-phosphate dehydrogenase
VSDPLDAPSAKADVLVIGGGITGCAVARDAAARGLTVVLVERRDLAAGTSGRSTKLLHGGLRYLEHGHVRLVREALREREITARLAPALAVPLRFVMPIWPGTFPGRMAARVGVGFYDLLAGRSPLPRGRRVRPREIAELVPALMEGYRGGVAFSDRQTDDARLTVSIARDAVRRGATIRLGLEVTALARTSGGHRAPGRHDDGTSTSIEARCVINAAGPWVDQVRRLDGLSEPLLRTSRGAHLVFERLDVRAALLLPGARRAHRLFAIPWRGVVLFGTTDVVDDSDPGRDEAHADDLRLLFREARRLFPRAQLSRRDVISAFTGVRPLIRQAGDTVAASREHAIRDEDGLITIAGGKLTTWRTMAIDAVDVAMRRLGSAEPSPAGLLEEPLPGGAAATPELADVLADEMPRHAEDVVFRRLPIGHDPHEVRRRLPTVVAAMRERFDWDPARAEEEHERVIARLEAQSRRLDEALGPESKP